MGFDREVGKGIDYRVRFEFVVTPKTCQINAIKFHLGGGKRA